ncbi:hypothetical protein Nepgr_000504 [Nepenthes gracilis]|uniref:Uncharacterized protein n=1 Tax=Nepenthes gracilis TaxID=150966 RepID=A0AAD3P1V4_NEPGR|nr:hypothetical protein Nepgr_000504 [Nepenthes gracilis]
MDILSTKDSRLHKVAEHFLKELSHWIGYDDIRRAFVIVALQKHSDGKFDCITGTKTVKDLMTEFRTESGCILFIQELTSMFLNKGNGSDEPLNQIQATDDNSQMGSLGDEDSAGISVNSDLFKRWVVDSLPSILKYLNLDPELIFQIQEKIMEFLAAQGLFSSSLGTEVTYFEFRGKFKGQKASISTAIRRMCIEQLQLLLCSAQKARRLP